MTQYLLSVYHVEGTQPPSEDETRQMYADVADFNDRLQREGRWVFAGGLHAPTSATVVRNTDGNVATTDGPFPESKEQLGGVWVITAGDLDAALALAADASRACGAPVEVRPFQEVPSGA
jgi:hypothetical protein